MLRTLDESSPFRTRQRPRWSVISFMNWVTKSCFIPLTGQTLLRRIHLSRPLKDALEKDLLITSKWKKSVQRWLRDRSKEFFTNSLRKLQERFWRQICWKVALCENPINSFLSIARCLFTIWMTLVYKYNITVLDWLIFHC